MTCSSTGHKLGGTNGVYLRGTTYTFAVQGFAAATTIPAGSSTVQATACAVPAMADWNGDGVNDLLVGDKTDATTGKVRVYLNQGTNTAPVFSTFTYAQTTTGDLTVAATGCLGAFPRMVDWNGDGKKDLLVGLADGRIEFFPNVGSNTAPVFGTPSYVQVGAAGAKADLNVGTEPPSTLSIGMTTAGPTWSWAGSMAGSTST